MTGPLISGHLHYARESIQMDGCEFIRPTRKVVNPLFTTPSSLCLHCRYVIAGWFLPLRNLLP